MTTLVINGGSSNDYADMLPELAAGMVVFTQNPLPAPERYAHYEHVADCESAPYTELAALRMASDPTNPISFEHVLTDNEYGLERAGRIRDRLDIPGQSEASARVFRDKALMKDVAAHGVSVPAFARLDTFPDLLEFIAERDYPVVVKPVCQGGARDIAVLRCEEDLTEFSTCRWRDDLMVEEFVPGEVYHLEAVIAPDFRFIATGRYYTSCLEVFSGANSGSVLLHPREPMAARLADFFDTLLKVLPAPDVGAYHLEVFHTLDDRLLLCEVASRVGGARIPQLIRHTYGIDLKETWFRLATGLPLRAEPVEAPVVVHGEISMTPRAGRVVAVPGPPPFDWVAEHVRTLTPGDHSSGPVHSASNVCWTIVSGTDSSQLMDRLHECEGWLDVHLEHGAPELTP
ncbi:ATP-grasp domain-containing protein [Streptomyces gobiensis]|uniref:ATP-grasp domain-containing protein n=1 Tax=Streptomyces gobiensis TaxID=2875706 RepID=UPI001E539FB8|nr:ATP-grasp domain-containing protein [Streptomyces gobiensis]UGY91702.1 ATP-grasp domain-containing protein [Streptomyces gobiensis]